MTLDTTQLPVATGDPNPSVIPQLGAMPVSWRVLNLGPNAFIRLILIETLKDTAKGPPLPPDRSTGMTEQGKERHVQKRREAPARGLSCFIRTTRA